jgi:hypothetical protein
MQIKGRIWSHNYAVFYAFCASNSQEGEDLGDCKQHAVCVHVSGTNFCLNDPAGVWRKLHNIKLQKLHSSQNRMCY